MSEMQLESGPVGSEQLQRRMRALGQDALEGRRELSDLLGDAFRELQTALRSVREMEDELSRMEQSIADLRAQLNTTWIGLAHPSREPPAAPGPADPGLIVDLPAFPEESLEAAADAARPPLDLFARPTPERPDALEASLRARIAGALYLGTLGAGDRLPSIREISRRTGLNHKVVRRVYRSLERIGLVEVRDRSGTYVTEDALPAAGGLEAEEGWISGILEDAVQRGIRIDGLPVMLERVVGARRLRCACVESTHDDRFALCHELEQRFGFESVSVCPTDPDLASAVAGADLVVTTPFHVDEVRAALTDGQPLVVASLHPALLRELEGRAKEHPVLMVCDDTASGNRLRHSFGPDLARRVQVITADRLMSEGWERVRPAGIATLAAWAHLGGNALPDLVVPPYLSPRTVGRIARLLVRLNRTPPAR